MSRILDAVANQFEKIGRVSSETVEKHTKKSWKEWITILDQAGARQWDHREIVDFLKRKFRLTAWWQQGVTSGYEIATGRRVEGQNTKGLWSLTASKTFEGDYKKLWDFIFSSEGLALWLQPLDEVELTPKQTFENHLGAFGEVRTMTKYRSLRMTWKDPEWRKHSVLQVWCVPRPNGKAIAVFTQDSLPTARVQEELRKHWKDSLQKISEKFSEAFPDQPVPAKKKSKSAQLIRDRKLKRPGKTTKKEGQSGSTRNSSRKNDRSRPARRSGSR